MTFDVCRKPLTAENLAAEMAAHRTRHGRLPAGLVVHKGRHVDMTPTAAGILGAGGVKILPVTGTGGCLADEFWLATRGENHDTK